MRLNKIIRGIAPIIAIAAAAGVAGCNSHKASWRGEEGVPLADLDMNAEPPEHVILMGSDSVIIDQGTAFAIDVEGSDDARDQIRFVLKEDSLGVLRKDGSRWGGDDQAVVRVTMPAPSKLTIAGSGDITTDALADEAEIVIAGSGTLKAEAVSVAKVDLTIAGSGSANMSGSATQLSLTIAGSGDAGLGGLQVEAADISIAGSGNATFASDGEVDASIAGAGNVTVRGSANCTVSSMGSGTLRCERGARDTDEAA